MHPQPNFVPIAGVFELDADGIIHFTAVQLPLGSAGTPIVEYAMRHNGDLDIDAVDRLIRSGKATATTVPVKAQ